MAQTKLCKDCRHARRASWFYRLINGPDKMWWCHRPGLPRSPVDGEIIPALCDNERVYLLDVRTHCGPEGQYFEAK